MLMIKLMENNMFVLIHQVTGFRCCISTGETYAKNEENCKLCGGVL